MPASEAQLLPGTRLLLTDKPGKPGRRRLKLLAKARQLTLGDGPGSAADPTLHGASLRVVSVAGGFDETYPLAADGWRPIKARNPSKGWRYGKGDPIRKVLVKAGRKLVVLGKGEALAHVLAVDPDPVEVVLTLGAQRYCLRFGGRTKTKAGRKYLAKHAPMPTACPGASGLDEAPAVSVRAEPPAGVAPLSVAFTARAFDPEGAAVTYTWQFGDGASEEGPSSTTHVYETPGTYRTTITASDGAQATMTFLLVDVGSETTATTIGTAGGTLTLGGLALTVPPDVFPEALPVGAIELPSQASLATDLDPARFVPIGPAYRLTGPFRTDAALALRLAYDPAAVPAGFDVTNLAILARAGPGFEDPAEAGPSVDFAPLPSVVDTGARTVETAVFAPGVLQVVALADPLAVHEASYAGAVAASQAGAVPAEGFRIVVLDSPPPPQTEAELVADLAAGLREAFGTYVLGKGFDAPMEQVTVFAKVLGPKLSGRVDPSEPRHVFVDPVKPIHRQRVVAHEYFHVIQLWNTNDASLDIGDQNAWFLEGTAEWAEDEVLDAVPNEYRAPTGERFTLPLNRRKAGDDLHYQTVAFWKWLASVDADAVRKIVDDHRDRTHALIGPKARRDNATAALYLDSLTQAAPDLDFLEFVMSALYRKRFDTDETGTGDLWTDAALGAAKDDLPPWFRDPAQDRVERFRAGEPGDGESNPKVFLYGLTRHLSADARVLANPADSGLAGILHVKLHQAPDVAAQVALVSRATQAERRERDLSSEREVEMGFGAGEEVVLLGVDPEPGPPDADANQAFLSAEAWVEACGGTATGEVVKVPCCSVDDLLGALAAAAPGDTVRMGAGVWNAPGRRWTSSEADLIDYPSSVVVWPGVTLAGTRSGQDLDTTLRLTGGDSGLLALDGSVVRDLRIIPLWWQGITTVGTHSLALCTIELSGNPDLVAGLDFVVTDGVDAGVDVFDSDFGCAGSCLIPGIEIRGYSPVPPGSVTIRTRENEFRGWGAGIEFAVDQYEPPVVLDVDCDDFRGGGNEFNVLEEPETEHCPE